MPEHGRHQLLFLPGGGQPENLFMDLCLSRFESVLMIAIGRSGQKNNFFKII
jgi:hypothetical protein